MQIVVFPTAQLARFTMKSSTWLRWASCRFAEPAMSSPTNRGMRADLALVCGPRLGPFDRRSQALAAEQAWLESELTDLSKRD